MFFKKTIIILLFLSLSGCFSGGSENEYKNKIINSEKIKSNIINLIKNNDFDKAYLVLESNKSKINNYRYLFEFIEEGELIVIKNELNNKASFESMEGMMLLKINRALIPLMESGSLEMDYDDLMDRFKSLSHKLPGYYGVDKNTAYDIFSMYMLGLFDDEDNISDYIYRKDDDYLGNESVLSNRSSCIKHQYTLSCKTNDSDNNKVIYLENDLRKIKKGLKFLFKSIRYDENIDNDYFSFNENKLFWNNLGISYSIKINEINNLTLKRDDDYSLKNWVIIINDDKNKELILDYGDLNEFKVIPFVSSLAYILNNYKSSSSPPIDLNIPDEILALLQKKNLLARHGGSILQAVDMADYVSDAMMVAGVVSTGGASLAAMGSKKAASKAAKAELKKFFFKSIKSLINTSLKLTKSFKNISKLKMSNISVILDFRKYCRKNKSCTLSNFKKLRKKQKKIKVANKKDFKAIKSDRHRDQLKKNMKNMGKSCKAGEQAHHIIPVNIALKIIDNISCSGLYDKNSKYYINGLNNGICLSSKNNISSASHSGSHPRYDEQIMDYLTRNKNSSCDEIFEKVVNCAKKSLSHDINIGMKINSTALILCEL